MEDLELALDRCLQQLADGEWNLAQCLTNYPHYAAELRPLLEAALEMQLGRSLRPSGAMRDRGRAKLAEHIEEHPRKRRKTSPPKLGIFFAIILLLALELAKAGLA